MSDETSPLHVRISADRFYPYAYSQVTLYIAIPHVLLNLIHGFPAAEPARQLDVGSRINEPIVAVETSVALLYVARVGRCMLVKA